MSDTCIRHEPDFRYTVSEYKYSISRETKNFVYSTMKYYPCTLALLFMGTVTVSQAAPLTVEDFCDIKTSAPVSVKEMRPMADGLTYAAISDDGHSIDVYSYKTGKQVNTLFSVDAIK